jgi:hypothetical protein
LNSAASTCGTVTIAQAALISLAPGGNTPAGTVSVPACVTLTTYAAPANGQYGLMGRLIRSAFFASEMVAIQPGGKVLNVWIDGQRGSPSTLLVDSAGMHNGQDVVAYSGANTTLSNSRIANSYGPQAVLFHGEQDIPGGGAACSANVIQNNVVTAYSSDYFHYVAATATTSNPSAAPYAEWEDGIDTACKATTISGNAVVDATDVSIGTFMAYPNTQASHVTSNTVLQAGNSTHAMLSADPLNPTGGPTDDFTGFVASQNHLWTSPYAHADFGVTLGTKAWFAGGSGSVGNGATVTNNDENGSVARVRIGIGVDGMNFPCVGCGTGGSGLNVMSGFQLVNPWPTSDPDVRAHGCSSGSAAAIAVDQTYTSYTANIQTPWIAENSSGGSGQLIGCETPLLWYANSNCSGYTGTCFTVSGSSSWRALPIFY